MAGCEKAGVNVAVAERTVTAPTVSEEVKQPATYFDKAIDWQAGGENPFRATIEERKQNIIKHPTLFSVWGNV